MGIFSGVSQFFFSNFPLWKNFFGLTLFSFFLACFAQLFLGFCS